MRKYVKSVILLVLFLGTAQTNSLWAQKKQTKTQQKHEKKLDKASKDYQNLEYIDAIKIYENVAKKGYESDELFTRLGNLYYYRAKYEEAAKWYKKLFKRDPKKVAPIVYLRYSQCLRAIGKKHKAEKYFNLFQKKTTSGNYKSALDYMALIQENSGRYKNVGPVKPLYDTSQITFGHAVLNNHLFYASTHPVVKSFTTTTDAWDGKSFFALYKIGIDSTHHVVGEPEKLHGHLNARYHDASVAFTKNGQTMYFTRSNFTGGKNHKDADKNLKIYRSQKRDGRWQAAQELSINSDSYSTAHPALTPDGKHLYFVSNRPGGNGLSDLYVVSIDSTGHLGRPKNLGDTINTGGRETFPYVSNDSLLYFSSDGHYGLGGLDVFAVKIKKDGTYGHLINIGKPINSYADDFSYGINMKTKYGFFSTDRSKDGDTLVSSNIYSFKQIKPLQDPFAAIIKGYVTDQKTGEAIPDATVNLINIKGDGAIYASAHTDENGHYKVTSERFKTYIVRAQKTGYSTDEKISKPKLKVQRIDLQLQNMHINEGVDLAKLLHIPIIYFDFDKATIRPDAEVQMEKLYQVMNTYPKLHILIRSHTDSRGSDAYNMDLSHRRAMATKKWLVDKGIDANRLKIEWLGESDPVNGCVDGVPCTEEEYQANRRSEFIVIKK